MSQNATEIVNWQLCNIGVNIEFCLNNELFDPYIGVCFALGIILLLITIASYFYYSKSKWNKWFVFNSVTIVQIFIAGLAITRVITFSISLAGLANPPLSAFFFALGFPFLLSSFLYIILLWAELYNASSKVKSQFLSQLAVPFLVLTILLFLFAGSFEFLAKGTFFPYEMANIFGLISNIILVLVIFFVCIVIGVYGFRLFSRLSKFSSTGSRDQVLIKITILCICTCVISILSIVALVIPLAVGRSMEYFFLHRVLECLASFSILGVTVISPKNSKSTASASGNAPTSKQQSQTEGNPSKSGEDSISGFTA